MFTNTKVTHAVRLALVFGATSTAVMSANAAAQQAEEAKKVERIEVTGSRIKRTDMETAQPVLAISQEDIARTGLVSVGDVLKEISTNGAALGLQTNNGNSLGVSRVNLRNCGSNRTLVLVNGRRWVADLGGAVDVSTIPLAAIRSIEVLKDGASSVYGTDAICGVVNVITKNDFDGAEVSAYNGQTSFEDGKRETYSATFGSSTEKSNVLLNVSYTKQESIMAADREISAVPIYGLPANVSNPGRASPTTPYGNFSVDGKTYTLTQGKAGCVANKFCDPSKVSDFKVYNFATDGYNFAPVNYIQQPSENMSLYTQAGYAITDTLNLKVEALYNERTSESQLAAQPMGGAAMAVSKDNMYNPFKKDISGATFRPIVAARSFGAESDTWRFGASLDGEFELTDRTFVWDVAATYSDNQMVQAKQGFLNAERVRTALGPSFVNSAGVATCGTAASPIAGCVPFNLFGGPEGVTPEMMKYVSVDPRDLYFSKMWDYSGNISTDLIELPAGMLAVNVGTEIRREFGYSSPDPLTAAGQVLNDNAFTPTKGGFNLKEVYAEVRVPLLSDMAYVESLDFEAATRYSDYSSFGDTTNNSYKLTYRPNTELLIRASFNEGFRAPSISDLYSGLRDSRPQAQDPCSIDSNAYKLPGVKERCIASGVSASFKQKDPQLRQILGGNELTQPETSESVSTGFVYSPEWIDGLGFSMDWYKIEISNFISSLGVGDILTRCYTQGIDSACALVQRDMSGSLNGNPGEISRILSTTANFKGGSHIEGIDWNVDYRFETTAGTWRVNWDSAYVIYNGDLGKLRDGEVTADGVISSGNSAGYLTAASSGGGTTFRLKSNVTLSWSKDDWSASLTANYQSKQDESCVNVTSVAANLNRPELRALCSAPDQKANTYAFKPGTLEVVATANQPEPRNMLDAVTYLDGQVGWTAPWNGDITVGVRNLLDKEPPISYSAFANSFDPNYRTPGRFYYVSYTQKF